jgi:hypothetical protein
VEKIMKKLMGAIAITTAALVTTTAFAENANDEKNANLDRLWGTNTYAASEAANAPEPFTSISSILINVTDTRDGDRAGVSTGAWADNFQGGRVEPPAGR